ncbi:hypothetical protein BDY19DRAFT_954585 [Irpex rosettiformis]|uniref:Uncharacterized protein n=1 Tax=Irpex rosettiformis TaxID=378272 RepID=A0ACB8U026_9APHY|nr:hypothetical protein BDY19DRAFT_954585 [Irpex rosettiformis]
MPIICLPGLDFHAFWQFWEDDLEDIADLRGIIVPQAVYMDAIRRDAKDYTGYLNDSVYFKVNGRLGVSVASARLGKLDGLEDPDAKHTFFRTSQSSLRILWPGYKKWSIQIGKPARGSVLTTAELAVLIAAQVTKFLGYGTKKNLPEEKQNMKKDEMGDWNLRHFPLDCIYLLRLDKRGAASWQPVLSIDPSLAKIPANKVL